MYLIVDAGNTNIKIGCFDNDKLQKLITFPKKKILSVKLPKFNSKIKSIYIGSVVPSYNKQIAKTLLNQYKCEPRIIENRMFNKHFDLKKYDLDEIGSDILALALYVKSHFVKGVGLCFGTANFAVGVNNKQIYGVMITPSFYDMFESLNKNTELTRTSKFDKDSNLYNYFDFGFDTKTALASGANHLTKGFIDELLSYSYKKYKITKICIAGGKTNVFDFLNKKDYAKKITLATNAVIEGYYLLVKDLIN